MDTPAKPVSARNQEHREYYIRHRERILAGMKRRRAANREVANQQKKEYYLKNKKKILERCKQYRQSERGKIVRRQYYFTESGRAAINRSQEKRKATRAVRLSAIYVYFRDKTICHLCARPVKPEEISLDHIIPASRGGQTIYKNMKLAHRTCNSQNGPGRIIVQLDLEGLV
jgi:5-methylcytosine-specific restriction endonuclease McrA